MARVWIGNFKGPKGDKGDKGDIGPQGPEGKQGPVGLVNADAAIEFEDYTTEGVEVPDPEEAFAEIVSGKSLKSIISNIRAFFKGAVTLGMIVNNLEDVLNVEEGTVLPVGCKAFQDLSAKMGNIKVLLYIGNSHNITFKPPWEQLYSENVNIMITTGYGLITATLNRDERAISNIAYHTKTGNINGEATVENGVVNIPASIMWKTTLMIFIPIF